MNDDLFMWALIWRAATDAFAGARVAEEILWMNGATWAQLWSGAIGAVAGAGVAMHVLRKTLREQATLAARNEQIQRELADKATETQSVLANQQLTEQRQALERQLSEQREALKLQLEEQRREATLNREHAAMAEVIAVISESVRAATGESAEHDRSFQGRINGTVGRWQLETSDPRLRSELVLWPNHWSDAVAAKRWPDARGLTQDEGEELMGRTIRGMLRMSREWTHSTEEERTEYLEKMSKLRAEIPAIRPRKPKVTKGSN